MVQGQEWKVNINNGSQEALISVKGLGPSLAQRIIEGRPYAQLSDLVRVSGINEIKLASLMPFLTLDNTQLKVPLEDKPTMVTADASTKQTGLTELTKTAPCAYKDFDQKAAILIILSGFLFGLLILLLNRKGK